MQPRMRRGQKLDPVRSRSQGGTLISPPRTSRIVERNTSATVLSSSPMPADKTVPMSFRFTPKFKTLLEAAAEREHRSLTSTLETLLFAYCQQHCIQADQAVVKSREEKNE